MKEITTAALCLMLVACGAPTTTTEIAPSVAQAPGVRHPIRVERADHVGQRWRMTTIGRELNWSVRLLDGIESEPEEESVVVELTAVTEVLEVDARGQQVRLAHTIERLERIVDGAPSTVLPAGSVVTVVRGAERVVQIDGAPADETQLEILGIVLELGVDQNDDDMFGTDQPRAVGESWDVDTEAARRDIPSAANPDSIRGQVRIDEELEVQGEPCLRLSAHLTLDGFEIPEIPGSRGHLYAQFEGTFPIDVARHELSERSKTTTTFEIPMGGRGSIRTRSVRDVRRTYELLPDR